MGMIMLVSQPPALLKKITPAICLLAMVVMLNACRNIQAYKQINAKAAEPEHWSNNSKSVVFIPMAHIGRPSFYESVTKVIEAHKQQGYIVFYEKVEFGEIPDSVAENLKGKEYVRYIRRGSSNRDTLTKLIYLAKLRRMTGALPDSSYFSRRIKNSTLGTNLKVQPSWDAFGVNTSDLNADITVREIVDQYEKKYGEITLTQPDLDIAFDLPNQKHRRLPRKQVMSVILDLRNEKLAACIHQSTNEKIVVAYGLLHQKGTLAELKKLDASWRVID